MTVILRVFHDGPECVSSIVEMGDMESPFMVVYHSQMA